MAAPPIITASERRLLGALLRENVRFMVVGLSAAAIQGAPVVTQDVDLWFEDLSNPALSKALQSVGAAYVPPFELRPPMLAGKGAELFDIVLRMDGLKSFNEEVANCIDVPMGRHRLKVLKLDRILVSKLAANRPKDKLTIPVLKNVLLANQTPKRRSRARKKSVKSSRK